MIHVGFAKSPMKAIYMYMASHGRGYSI